MVSHLRLGNTIVFWAMWNWNRYAKERNKGQDLEIRVVHSHQISKEYPTPGKTALVHHLWPPKLDTNNNLMYCSVGYLWQATVRFAHGKVYLRGTQIWRPENSVNIWNFLWLSRRLIISTDQTSIYRSTFPNQGVHHGKHRHQPFQKFAEIFVGLQLKIFKPREFYFIEPFTVQSMSRQSCCVYV